MFNRAHKNNQFDVKYSQNNKKPKAVNIIGIKCLTISQTRYLYIADNYFLFSFRVEINIFLQLHVSSSLLINNNIEVAYKLLVLLKMYWFIVEKDQFYLYNVVQLTRGFFLELKSLFFCIENEDWEDTIDIVDCSMRKKKLNIVYNETITAYCLFSQGRAELREKNKELIKYY